MRCCGSMLTCCYSCTLSLTSAIDGVGGHFHVPAALPPEKSRYPLHTRLGGPQGLSEVVRKIWPLAGFDSWTFQSIASRYTDLLLQMQSKPAGSVWVWDMETVCESSATSWVVVFRVYQTLCTRRLSSTMQNWSLCLHVSVLNYTQKT
jgi:hypothetical protein